MKKNLILIGMPCVGKTSLGYELSERLDMLFADADDIFQFEHAQSIADFIASFGEQVFRDYESKVVRYLCSCVGLVIATGGGAVLHSKNVSAMREGGIVIFLDASLDTLKSRLQERPLIKDISTLEKMYEDRHNLYLDCAHAIVDTNGLSIEEVAQKVCEAFIDLGGEQCT